MDVYKIYIFQFHQIMHPIFEGELEMSTSLKSMIGEV